MFTISLHQVKIFAPIGLYPQEWLLGNHFEVDIDVSSTVSNYDDGRFVDYTILNSLIQQAFVTEEQTLEAIAQNIHASVLSCFPFVQKIKVSIRKLNPPMPGEIAYAQVCFEA